MMESSAAAVEEPRSEMRAATTYVHRPLWAIDACRSDPIPVQQPPPQTPSQNGDAQTLSDRELAFVRVIVRTSSAPQVKRLR